MMLQYDGIRRQWLVFDQGLDLTLAGDRLHQGDVVFARGFDLPAPDATHNTFFHTEKCLQTLLPLLEQLGPVHHDQCIDTAPGDDRRSGKAPGKD